MENDSFKEKSLQFAKIWEKYLSVLDSLAGISNQANLCSAKAYATEQEAAKEETK
ncbi:ABC transporter ATP-binding protein [Ectobacillus funiculus]|uniref:ABC transporter ATP-binding protein n=1 Tax=Ectobacillus funiculus TaxID=137993 RepID=UPI0013EE1BF3|nr:ABC transporter ATP-binding protein [Ectobacillus funiculus]